jgi:hypothetical protein
MSQRSGLMSYFVWITLHSAELLPTLFNSGRLGEFVDDQESSGLGRRSGHNAWPAARNLQAHSACRSGSGSSQCGPVSNSACESILD